jgi:hypothetical protein
MADGTARNYTSTIEHSALRVAPAIALGRVQEVSDTRARVRVGGVVQWLDIDPSVDPALVEEARARNARVVIDGGADGEEVGPCVVGVLMTTRTLEIARRGNVEAKVKKLVLDADEALIRTPKAFLRLRASVSELFGEELVVRGRLLTRIFGKTIKLN